MKGPLQMKKMVDKMGHLQMKKMEGVKDHLQMKKLIKMVGMVDPHQKKNLERRDHHQKLEKFDVMDLRQMKTLINREKKAIFQRQMML